MDFRIIPTDLVQIYLLFYKPKRDDPLLNRLVSYFDGPFCHIEMAFPDKWGEQPWEREIWGSSIYQNETVFFKPKTYARDGYFSVAIEVTVPQMYRIKSFCKHQYEQKVAFSPTAMYFAYSPHFQFVHTDKTFCSKHVAAALQYGGVEKVMGLNPALMTPSKLHAVFASQTNGRDNLIVQVLPSKMFAHGARDKCTASMVKALL